MKVNPVNRLSNFINKILIRFGIDEPTRLAFIRYFFNTGWMFAEKVLVLVLTFFVGVYIVRYLGPTQYGLLSYAFSFFFLFQAISKLGLDGIVVRNLLQTPEKKAQIIGTSIVLKSIGSILSLSFTVLGIYFIESDNLTKLLVFIIALSMVFSGFETIQFWFESQVQAKYNAIVSTITGFVGAAIKVILLIVKADLIWFAAVFSIEMLLKQFGLIFIYRLKQTDIFTFKFNGNLAKQFLKDSWPLIISSVAVILSLRIDQIMIKEMLGEKEVGLYSAAVNISEIWYFIPVIISGSLFPAIMDAKNKSQVLYEKRLQQFYNLNSIISVVIMVPILIFGKYIVNTLFGNPFSEAGVVLQIHILSLLFAFMGQASGMWLLAENYYKISMYRTLAGAALNIIANSILIKNYGIVGAAISTLLSYMLAGFLFDVFLKKTRKSFYMKCKSLNFYYLLKIKQKNK